MTNKLAIEDLAALRWFARAHGRCWKQALREHWEKGTLDSACYGMRGHSQTLQFLRNADYFGPKGLVECRISREGM